MIACKQVAKALAHNRYYELPWWKRVSMFTHIKLCIMCGKYHQQVVDLQKGVHDYLEHEEIGDIDPHIHLSEDEKQRIELSLKQN